MVTTDRKESVEVRQYAGGMRTMTALNDERTDDLGLEVRVVEVHVMHEDIVEADHESEDREKD